MKNKNVLLPIIFIMSVILAYILYVSIVVYADDTGTYVYMYNYYELGSFVLPLYKKLSPWFISGSISYLLNIGGTGSTISIAYLAVWYLITVFFTFLIIKNSVQNKWLILMAFFILIPYEYTNRYHMFSTFVAIFLLWCIQQYLTNKKKWYIVLGLMLTGYTVLFSEDRVILVMFVGVTFAAYVLVLFLQDNKKYNYLYLVGFAVTFVSIIIKFVDRIGSLGITSEFGGYGGSEYLKWTTVATLFEKGLPSVLNSILRQWNVPVSGGMIQFMSFYWIVRIVIVGLAIVALISYWIKIIKKGIVSLELIDAVAVICVTAVWGINICNGMLEYYSLDEAPINRYASICWFLLVVILVRWIDDKYSNQNIYKKFNTNILLSFIFVMLCVGYINPVFGIKDEVINSYCLEEIDYLKEHGDNYKYGLASIYKASAINAATNNEYVVCGGWVSEGKLTCDSATQYSNYSDGTNYFNFIISDPGREMTVSPKNINELRPDYVGTTSTMYLYDYDIRFDTRLVMECWEEDGDYELTDDITYNLEFPVGTNRIHLEVGNSDNFNISLEDNSDIKEYSVQVLNENEIYVDLVCTQNTNVVVNIGRLGDEYTTIHKICLKRVRASITVDENVTDYSQQIFLKEGSYVITFDGTDIKNMQVEWSGTDISVEQLTDGKIKRRYQIDVTTPQTVELNISGSDNMVIDKISYENAVLFDEDEE
jgi:hypothetical protein